MKVLHISTYDVRGGAALAAYRLHRAMQKRPDCDSTMLVRTKDGHDPDVMQNVRSMAFLQRAKRKIERWQIEKDYKPYSKSLSKAEIFSDDRGLAEDITENLKSFDIIQLHFVAQFFNYRHFFNSAPKTIPLVWRLSDMNPFTGGCHYDGDCGRFEKTCGCCPVLESRQEDDLSRAIWKRKKDTLRQLARERLHIVALNQWMAGQVKRSSLLRQFDCSVISNGVDLDDFKAINPVVAREALGIPSGYQVVAVVAYSVSIARKGFRPLLQALDSLKARRNLFLLVVGEPHQLPPLDLPALVLGPVQAMPYLRQIYSAADLFVISSLEDNQPNTVLEAMACGTPVVGFKTGGIPEMVEEGITGLLAPCGDIRGLARAIEYLLDHDQERQTMSTNSRRRVETAFSREGQVQQYIDLYSRLLLEHQPRGETNRSVCGFKPALTAQTLN